MGRKDQDRKKHRDRQGDVRAVPTPVQRASRILKEFYELARTIADDHGLARDESFPFKSLVLPVQLHLDQRPGREERQERAEQLVSVYRARLLEGLKALETFRMGSIYCFQCDSIDCRHALPPSPIHVFVGYQATGKPGFETFPNVCLSRGDTRIERLYSDLPQVVAIAQGADELKRELLPAFGCGSLAYNVLGQVITGLVPSDLGASREPPGRVALTVQFLETRSGSDRRRLRLNLLGMNSDHIAEMADTSEQRGPAARLSSALRAMRQRLAAIEQHANRMEQSGKTICLEDAIHPLVQQLRGDLERMFKSHRGRTEHARQRHAEGQRPTGQALSDVRRASGDRIFMDAHTRAYVVLGPKNRAHLFTSAGKHMTSMQLDPGELDRKVGRRRWRPVSPETAGALKERIILLADGDEAGVST